MSVNTKKVVIIIVKVIVCIVLVLLAFLYAMRFGYFLNGLYYTGAAFGMPYFIVFSLVLLYVMFTRKKIKYYLTGLLIIYTLAIKGFTEYMNYVSSGQSMYSEWYIQMYKECGIDFVYNWFLLGWAVVSSIYMITIYFYLNKNKNKNKKFNGSKENIGE